MCQMGFQSFWKIQDLRVPRYLADYVLRLAGLWWYNAVRRRIGQIGRIGRDVMQADMRFDRTARNYTEHDGYGKRYPSRS